MSLNGRSGVPPVAASGLPMNRVTIVQLRNGLVIGLTNYDDPDGVAARIIAGLRVAFEQLMSRLEG